MISDEEKPHVDPPVHSPVHDVIVITDTDEENPPKRYL